MLINVLSAINCCIAEVTIKHQIHVSSFVSKQAIKTTLKSLFTSKCVSRKFEVWRLLVTATIGFSLSGSNHFLSPVFCLLASPLPSFFPYLLSFLAVSYSYFIFLYPFSSLHTFFLTLHCSSHFSSSFSSFLLYVPSVVLIIRSELPSFLTKFFLPYPLLFSSHSSISLPSLLSFFFSLLSFHLVLLI